MEIRLAPWIWAASSSATGIVWTPLNSIRISNGKVYWTRPIVTPISLLTSSSGAAITPSASKAWLSRPAEPSRMFSPITLITMVTSEVITTRLRRMAAFRLPVRAST